MSETFRNIRTNLQFMLGNQKKVILVTSTVTGEGKSFISANLAISLSLMLARDGLDKAIDILKKNFDYVFWIQLRLVW